MRATDARRHSGNDESGGAVTVWPLTVPCYEKVLNGELSLVRLRILGVNTEAIKNIKSKKRRVPIGDGKTEKVIDREIELHDRSGPEFNRIANETAGSPKQSIEGDLKTEVNMTEIPDDQVEKIMRIMAMTHLTDPA